MFVLKVTALALSLFLSPAKAAVSEEVFENCAFLGDSRLQVFWTVRSNDSAVDFQLCGCDRESLDGMETPNEYMGFGLSGSTTSTLMQGADVTIAYVDENEGPVAVDYFLSAYTQCREGEGACPDTLDASGGCTNDVSNVAGFRREGLQCVSFTRTFQTDDSTCDLPIDPSNEEQYIVWGVGGVGETAFKHFERANADDPPLHLGRESEQDCAGGLRCPNCPPFQETVMDATGRNETFVANVGPTGNQRGYMAIANQAGWGYSWYINDTLIPRIIVERGYTYTFISEGGRPEDRNNHHPFYLTDSRRGGRLTNSERQQEAEIVFAGFDEDGTPLGVGPYCPIIQPTTATTILNTCGPQAEYIAALIKEPCSSSGPRGYFTWTPDSTTPDTIYYQCATHSSFGYEITVMPLLNAPDSASKLVAYSTSILLMVLLALAF